MNLSLAASAGPAPTRLVTGDDVWMDGEALRQLDRAAALTGCVRAVGFPDLHGGPGGLPIGVALAFADRIGPALIGTDIGCGVRLVITGCRPPSLDRLERRLRAALEAGPIPGASDPEVVPALLARGLAGLADHEGLPAAVRRLLASADPDPTPIDPATLPPGAIAALHAASLGTVGGGNHFAEVAVVDAILDPAVAAARGIERGRLAVLVHSGSRSVGHAVAAPFGAGFLAPGEAGPYLAGHAWACRFARPNRRLLAGWLLLAAEAARPGQQACTVDAVHNQILPISLDGQPAWLHRKGVAPAGRGELTIVLGSRGAPSFLMLGTGSEAGLGSVAHGAGRRLTRAEALGKLRAKHPRRSLCRTALGSRVIGDRPEALYEEHPDAYKPVQPVIDALVAAGLATGVATLRPLITVKP